MLFPRDPQATTTSIELVREHDGFPVVLATGLLGGDASGLPLLPNGPGLPQWPMFKTRTEPPHVIGDIKEYPSSETLNAFDAQYQKIVTTLGIKKD